MSITEFPYMKEEIDWINNLVEFERSLAGNDDELEDEM